MVMKIPRKVQVAFLLSVHPIDIMRIKFNFSFREKTHARNYVPLTCQFIRDLLTDRVPIILTDPGSQIPQRHA